MVKGPVECREAKKMRDLFSRFDPNLEYQSLS